MEKVGAPVMRDGRLGVDVLRGQPRGPGAGIGTHSKEGAEVYPGADLVVGLNVVPAIVQTRWSLPPIATLRSAPIRRARTERKHPMSVPPSARVLVCKGSREEAIVVSKGTPGDMSNSVVLSEHRAMDQSRVVVVERDGRSGQ